MTTRSAPSASASTTHPSAPLAFKSLYYVEDDPRKASAAIKVDYDEGRNPYRRELVLAAIRAVERVRERTATAPPPPAPLVRTRRRYRVVDVEVYRTRKGRHVRMWVGLERDGAVAPLVERGPGTPSVRHLFLPAATVLRVQAIAGDDPERQRFNARRVRRGEAFWNVLWTSKHRNGRMLMVEDLDQEETDAVRATLRGDRA